MKRGLQGGIWLNDAKEAKQISTIVLHFSIPAFAAYDISMDWRTGRQHRPAATRTKLSRVKVVQTRIRCLPVEGLSLLLSECVCRMPHRPMHLQQWADYRSKTVHVLLPCSVPGTFLNGQQELECWRLKMFLLVASLEEEHFISLCGQ